MLTAWVFGLSCGLFAGWATADVVEAAAERQRAQVHEVSAALVEDAVNGVSARVAADHRVQATVRWTGADGSTYADEARVPPGTRAGSVVTVWTDASGQITVEPLTDGESRLHAVAGGVLAATGACGTVLGAAWVVRLRMEQRRLEQWAVEWERIDTRRGGKTG